MNNQYITISGLNIEIFDRDLIKMKWVKALDHAIRIGDGWRLPTIEEMCIIKSIKDIGAIGNFPNYQGYIDYYYWTSKEAETSANYSYCFEIRYGEISTIKKSSELRSRYVRDI